MEFEVMLEKLASRIHTEMNRKKWNIKKLSIESKVDPKVISKLLRSQAENPELKTLDKIATAFGITLENFCDSTGKK